jgi:hypothetical protein
MSSLLIQIFCITALSFVYPSLGAALRTSYPSRDTAGAEQDLSISARLAALRHALKGGSVLNSSSLSLSTHGCKVSFKTETPEQRCEAITAMVAAKVTKWQTRRNNNETVRCDQLIEDYREAHAEIRECIGSPTCFESKEGFLEEQIELLGQELANEDCIDHVSCDTIHSELTETEEAVKLCVDQNQEHCSKENKEFLCTNIGGLIEVSRHKNCSEQSTEIADTYCPGFRVDHGSDRHGRPGGPAAGSQGGRGDRGGQSPPQRNTSEECKRLFDEYLQMSRELRSCIASPTCHEAREQWEEDQLNLKGKEVYEKGCLEHMPGCDVLAPEYDATDAALVDCYHPSNDHCSANNKRFLCSNLKGLEQALQQDGCGHSTDTPGMAKCHGSHA